MLAITQKWRSRIKRQMTRKKRKGSPVTPHAAAPDEKPRRVYWKQAFTRSKLWKQRAIKPAPLITARTQRAERRTAGTPPARRVIGGNGIGPDYSLIKPGRRPSGSRCGLIYSNYQVLPSLRKLDTCVFDVWSQRSEKCFVWQHPRVNKGQLAENDTRLTHAQTISMRTARGFDQMNKGTRKECIYCNQSMQSNYVHEWR